MKKLKKIQIIISFLLILLVLYTGCELYNANAPSTSGGDNSLSQIDHPEVLLSSPANGDINVETDITDVTINFDQEMLTSGYSYIISPSIDSSEEWINSTTFRINFNDQLNEEVIYRIILNPSGSDQNFKSISNVRLVQDTKISFATKADLYTASIESPDLTIYDVIVERIVDNIRFSVDYESGHERGYSFFDPPDGSVFLYYNTTSGIYVGRNIFIIDVPVSKVNQVSLITMNFVNEEGYDDIIVIKVSAFSDLLY